MQKISANAKRYVCYYMKLGKFRLCLLVLFTALSGYLLGVKQFDLSEFISFLLGTLLMAMGANGLNQCWEKSRDQLMQRTRLRPLPAGNLSLTHGLLVTSLWSLSGIVLLAVWVNLLTAFLGALTLITYVLIYTPIKPVSPIAVLVGAIPGAIPPLMGWSAATNSIELPALVLGCILFLWQIPHFMSLASIYKIDYEKGGFNLLIGDPFNDKATRSVILVFSLALTGICLLAPGVGLGATLFVIIALLLGGVLTVASFKLYLNFSVNNARRVFRASIVYIPLLLIALVVDQRLILGN